MTDMANLFWINDLQNYFQVVWIDFYEFLVEFQLYIQLGHLVCPE